MHPLKKNLKTSDTKIKNNTVKNFISFQQTQKQNNINDKSNDSNLDTFTLSSDSAVVTVEAMVESVLGNCQSIIEPLLPERCSFNSKNKSNEHYEQKNPITLSIF